MERVYQMRNRYIVCDDVTAIIITRRNKEPLKTIIETKDLEKVKSFPNKWSAYESNGKFYVIGCLQIEGKKKTVRLHRWVMDAPDDMDVDHINGNSLDNRRTNLRLVTHQENMQNRGASKNNSSGYRGVYWYKPGKRWRATTMFNKKQYYLGEFKDKKDAINAVVEFRKKHVKHSPEANDRSKNNEDLTTKRFGRLKVTEKIKHEWKCRCDCGKEIVVSTNDLITGWRRSCGCWIKGTLKKKEWEILESVNVEGTRLSAISNNVALSKRNKSGVRGVSWDSARNKWFVSIGYKGKNIKLGRFDNLEDAIKVRKEAEEKYYKPLLEKYKFKS